MKNHFELGDITAYEAITEAQKIAFSPLIFQAVRTMRELGILEAVEQSGDSGLSVQELTEQISVSPYGITTLLESGVSCGVIEQTHDERFILSKVGYYLLRDPMTRINMDYNHHVCYLGMYYLDEAVRTEKPAGLNVFGEQWQTLYQALPHLPEKVKQSWYAFDHFYSDSAYPAAAAIVLDNKPRTLVDIGANIGKFSILLAREYAEIHITMIDLPDQLENAVRNVREAGLTSRIKATAMDLLQANPPLPAGQDVYWLSQLLSCFGPSEIIHLLSRVREVMADNSVIYILETCWDRQQHAAAAYSLINTSLYFTSMASGNSKMYHSSELSDYIEKAGLKIDNIQDQLGVCHSLFTCSRST